MIKSVSLPNIYTVKLLIRDVFLDCMDSIIKGKSAINDRDIWITRCCVDARREMF